MMSDPVGQDAHRLARCAADPDVVWCQHHNGMFRSVDGGANWTEIVDVQPSVFGFPVAAHPHDPLTAWFVPAEKTRCASPWMAASWSRARATAATHRTS